MVWACSFVLILQMGMDLFGRLRIEWGIEWITLSTIGFCCNEDRLILSAYGHCESRTTRRVLGDLILLVHLACVDRVGSAYFVGVSARLAR